MTVEQVISSLEVKLCRDPELLLSVIELIELAAGLKPVNGDKQFKWRNRGSCILARCDNCGFLWPAGHMPMRADRLNQITTRLSICSRCGETERIVFNHVKLQPSPRKTESTEKKRKSPTEYCAKSQTQALPRFSTSRVDEQSASDVVNIFVEERQAH